MCLRRAARSDGWGWRSRRTAFCETALEALGSRGMEVAGGQEADGADVVVVALERLDAVVGAVEVPDLDGHVRGARGEQLAAGGQVERDVLDRVGVTLKTEKNRVLLQFLQEMWTKGNTCVDVVNCENVACVKMLTDGHATCHATFIASGNAFEGERNIVQVKSMDAI